MRGDRSLKYLQVHFRIVSRWMTLSFLSCLEFVLGNQLCYGRPISIVLAFCEKCPVTSETLRDIQ